MHFICICMRFTLNQLISFSFLQFQSYLTYINKQRELMLAGSSKVPGFLYPSKVTLGHVLTDNMSTECI